MNKILTSVIVTSFMLAFPIAGVSASGAPPNVKGVTARLAGDTLVVQWMPVTDPAVTRYRVYYSRASIMDNRGDYDDFVETTSNQQSYTFSTVPYKGKALYVSVMAVTAQGVESEAFESEASVPATQPPALSASASSASSEARAEPATTNTSAATPTIVNPPAADWPAYVPTPKASLTEEIPEGVTSAPAPSVESPLSEAGIGLLGIMLASGGAAGVRLSGRKKQA